MWTLPQGFTIHYWRASFTLQSRIRRSVLLSIYSQLGYHGRNEWNALFEQPKSQPHSFQYWLRELSTLKTFLTLRGALGTYLNALRQPNQEPIHHWEYGAKVSVSGDEFLGGLVCGWAWFHNCGTSFTGEDRTSPISYPICTWLNNSQKPAPACLSSFRSSTQCSVIEYDLIKADKRVLSTCTSIASPSRMMRAMQLWRGKDQGNPAIFSLVQARPRIPSSNSSGRELHG